MYYYIESMEIWVLGWGNPDLKLSLELMSKLGMATPWTRTEIIEKYKERKLDRYFNVETQYITADGTNGKYCDVVIQHSNFPSSEELKKIEGFHRKFRRRLEDYLRKSNNIELLYSIFRLIENKGTNINTSI